jgi:hypothetical protein
VASVIAYQPPDDVAGLVPAAWYVAAEHVATDPELVPRRHGLLGFAVLLIAVGASLAAPVAGGIVVTVGVTVLRAAGRATESLAARRLRRGRRRSDPFVLLASAPWLLAWAVVETVLVAALVLLAAAIAVVTAVTFMGARQPALAAAAVAGVYTVLICVGPRSGVPRRQLSRFLDPVARTPLTVGVVTVMLAAVAVGVMFLAVPGRPALWPTQSLRAALVRLTGTESGACLPPPPAMRLSTLCAAPRGTDGPSPRAASADSPGR